MTNSIFELLKDDNAEILALFGKLEDTSAADAQRRTDLVERLSRSIGAHQRAADATFVPILASESAPPPDALDAWHSVSREIVGMFDDLGRLPPADEQFMRDLKILHERVEERVQLEENGLLPALERVILGDEAERLAERARAELGEPAR